MEEIKEKLKEINVLIEEEKDRAFLIFADGKHIEISKFFVKIKGVSYLNFYPSKDFIDLIIDTEFKKNKINIRLSKKHVGLTNYEFKIGSPTFKFEDSKISEKYYPDYIIGVLIEFIILKIEDFNKEDNEINFK